MNQIIKSKQELKNLTIEQIDEILNNTEVDVVLVQNKDTKKLIKWNELCGLLIDIRCEKLGIKL